MLVAVGGAIVAVNRCCPVDTSIVRQQIKGTKRMIEYANLVIVRKQYAGS